MVVDEGRESEKTKTGVRRRQAKGSLDHATGGSKAPPCGGRLPLSGRRVPIQPGFEPHLDGGSPSIRGDRSVTGAWEYPPIDASASGPTAAGGPGLRANGACRWPKSAYSIGSWASCAGRPLAAASYSSASSWQKIKTDQASERMRCMIRTILCASSDCRNTVTRRSGPRTRLNGRFACKSG